MIYVLKAIHFCQPIDLKTFQICLETYELDPAKFISAPGLAWQAYLKTTKVKLNLLNNIEMLLIVKKVQICRNNETICYCIYQYTKDNNKYMKDYEKSKVW